jgi:hypothetical protein
LYYIREKGYAIMKKPGGNPGTCYSVLAILIVGTILSACSSSQKTLSLDRPVAYIHSDRKTFSEDPATISLYTPDKIPPASYHVVGEAIVSRYNPVGIMRQKAIIHDHLRSLAASMGGNAIINIRKNRKYVMGTVISMPDIRNKIIL